MALFRPTNITPNLMSSTADGTVDANEDLTISWHINGSSPMRNYNLQIYEVIEDDAQTSSSNTPAYADTYSNYRPVYGTLQWTMLENPVYGKDNLGNVVPFSVTIPASSITEYANGKRYIMDINVGWGEEFIPIAVLTPPASENASDVTLDDDSGSTSDTSSASSEDSAIETAGDSGIPYADKALSCPGIASFQTVAAPSFSVNNHEDTITTREHHFDFLTFSDESPQWFQWILSLNDGSVSDPVPSEVISNTGRIFGSGDISFDYAGFVNGVQYVLQCIACDSYGRICESEYYGYRAEYQEVTMEFPITVTASKVRSAIRVEWAGAFTIPGVANGNYTIGDDRTLLLPTTSDSVIWNQVSSGSMSFETPWTLLYKGKLMSDDAVLWELGQSLTTRTVRLRYALATNTLTLEQGSNILKSYNEIEPESIISTILTIPTSGSPQFYIRIDYMSGGLYPATTLYPGQTLYPSDNNRYSTEKKQATLSGTTFDDISSISVYGKQKCYFIEELTTDSSVLPAIIDAMYNNMAGDSVNLGEPNFFATFEAGLQAGSLYFLGYEIAGWAIYRTENQSELSNQIAVLPMGTTGFYDYSARTDGTKYLYEIAPIFTSNGTYTNGTAIRSDSPFGIRNSVYSIIECQYDEDAKCYIAIKEYDFDKNVKTDAISNNNTPSILTNFTQYPTVQLSSQNYKSGSLSSLIGVISLTDYSQIEYNDTRELRDAIYALSVTTNPLFLKTRKGDVLKIQIANSISMSVMDNTLEQALEASVPWVEVENDDGLYVLSYRDIEHTEDYYDPDTSMTPIIPVGEIPIRANGRYEIRQYAIAQVNVPNSYTENDQGKVVSGNELIDQGSRTILENGTYDTKTTGQVIVNVAGPTLVQKAVSANGTYTAAEDGVAGYDSVVVDVPNTYTSEDKGKVVVDGALTVQTSRTLTQNDTYDTTTNNSVTVEVLPVLQSKTATANGTVIPDDGYDGLSSVVVAVASATLGTKTITENGTYDASADDVDGYSRVVVSVSGTGAELPSAAGNSF